jgi:REP element-mobilizing transposase RayT
MTNIKPDTFYHIYNRGNNRELIYFNDENYNYFLRLVKKYISEIGEVYSYCLLPNHFHFLIKIKEINNIPEKFKKDNAMILHQPFSNLFNAYTKAINKQENRVGSLFQKHFKRLEIKSTEQLVNTMIYINTNSSHHSIMDYKQYHFSSYNALVSDKETDVKRQKVIELFDDLENFKFLLDYKKDSIGIENNVE